jgi:type 1 glutamine amidotransferase
MRASSLTLAVIAAVLLHSPSPLFASKILLLSSGDAGAESNTYAIQSALQAAGDTVTIGPTYDAFTGSGLAGYNAVFLNPNSNWWNASDMPVAGQQALLNYVNQGGGLVTGAMVSMWNEYPGEFRTLGPALPAWGGDPATFNSPIVFTSLTANSVMNAGLPSTFSFTAGGYDTEIYLTPKATNATTFFTTNQWTPTFGGAGVSYGSIGWNYGAGRVLNLSTFSDNVAVSNATYDQMLVNSINWAAQSSGGSPLPNPAPEPTSLAVFIAASLGLLIVSRTRRRPHA